MQYTTARKNIPIIIKDIGDATKCEEWVKHVTEDFLSNDKKIIPDYLIPFFCMGKQFIANDDAVPIIQTAHLKKGCQDARTFLSSFDLPINDEEDLPTKNKEKVDESTFASFRKAEYDLPEQDSFSKDTNFEPYCSEATVNWGFSLLFLFNHMGIRRVGDGSTEKNKFAFWPTCAPNVNHRLPSISQDLYGEPKVETQFIPTIFEASASLSWDGTKVCFMPYAVDVGLVDPYGNYTRGCLPVRGCIANEPTENHSVMLDDDENLFLFNGFAAGEKKTNYASDLVAKGVSYKDAADCFRAITVSFMIWSIL